MNNLSIEQLLAIMVLLSIGLLVVGIIFHRILNKKSKAEQTYNEVMEYRKSKW